MGRIIDRRRVMGKKGLLPSGYTQVEYIESTGSQRIDTGVEGDVRWIITAQATSINARVLLCSSLSGDAGTWIGGYVDSNYWTVGSRIYVTLTKTTKVLIDAEMTSSGVNAKFNDETAKNKISVTQRRWYLFDLSGGYGSFIGKVWDAQIIQHNILVRNLIPARRNSDNAVGMYDLVNNTFYTNTGTGNFIAGPEV